MIILMASLTNIRNVTECKDSGLISCRTWFSQSSLHVGFVVVEVVVGMVSVQRVRLFPVSITGHAVAQLAEVLHYKPEGRGFDYRWCHLNCSLA
jgi:hypothetical protein